MDKTKNIKTISAVLLLLVSVSYVFYSQIFGFSNSLIKNRQDIENCPKSLLSDKTIILRVDDVQAFTWFDTTSKMIADARGKGIFLTLGVIPIGLNEDTALISFFKKHECMLEFALHGWDHSSGEDDFVPEFELLNEEQANEKINSGLKNLAQITDNPVVTWIPPFNSHSSATIEVLKNKNFRYLSTEGEGEWDYDAATFEYEGNTLVAPEKIIADCEQTFLEDTKCVVMLHPQDFADDLTHNEEKYQTYYLDLLDAMKEKGYTFARFSDFGE